MIVSHKLRLIFLKTRKTAGTSLEIALSEHCGPTDIITPVSPDDEATRQSLGFRGAQNQSVGTILLQNHAPAPLVRQVVGPTVWAAYRKVTIVRNPFDKAISQYWFARRLREDAGKPGLEMTAFLRNEPERMTNWSIYTIDDEVVADHVIRYENFEAETAALATQFGLPRLRLVRAKGGYRTDRRPYREVLSPEDRAIIEASCAKELSHFGYQW